MGTKKRSTLLDKIGERYINTLGYTATIIGVIPREGKKREKFICKFDESGYEFVADRSQLLKGLFKDYGRPTVSVVGITYYGAAKTNPVAYKTWANMLDRCYNVNAKCYHLYGGAGVTVDSRWFYFKNFEEDIKNLPNYDKHVVNSRAYSLDKDIVGDGTLYSKDTCMFASQLEQAQAQKRVSKILCIPPVGESFIANSKREAARLAGVKNAQIYQVLKGKAKKSKGYSFVELE